MSASQQNASPLTPARTDEVEQDARSPLSGIVVLDLTRVLSGPFATMLLGDLGADVIKVERIEGGDDTRWFPPMKSGVSHYFLSVNRNKRSIAVDLKSPRGLDIVKDLASRADVLVENFRPGVAGAMGLDYGTLSKRNPKLVYCSISGFGQTGACAQRAAFDIVIQALSGAMSVNGQPDGQPTRLGIPLGDLSAGLFAAIGTLAGLLERERTSHGAWVDIGMLDSMIGMLGYLAGHYLMTGESPGPVGSRHHSIAPYGAYPAADGSIVIGIVTEAFWPRLCRALGLGAIEVDPRFRTNDVRWKHRVLLDRIIEDRLADRGVEEWSRRLLAEDIPHAPILTVGDALEQEFVHDRGLVQTVKHPTLGDVRLVGPNVKFVGAAPAAVSAPPNLGEHTTDILRDMLGLTDTEIELLLEDRSVLQGDDSGPGI